MGDTPNFEGLWGTTLQLDFDFFFHIYDISSITYRGRSYGLMSQIFLGTPLFDRFIHQEKLSRFFFDLRHFSSIAPLKTEILKKIPFLNFKIFI